MMRSHTTTVRPQLGDPTVFVKPNQARVGHIFHIPDPEQPTHSVCGMEGTDNKPFFDKQPHEIPSFRVCGNCMNRGDPKVLKAHPAVDYTKTETETESDDT